MTTLDQSSCWCVVVARTGPGAKSRLAEVLGQDERAALARAMLADVLTVCAQLPWAGILVVTDTGEGCALAERLGGQALPDPGLGMNAAVQAGIQEAAARGARLVLVLPGDLPYLTTEALGLLTADASTVGRRVSLAVDRAGSGTNALLLQPPECLRPMFGEASARRHLLEAERAGIPTSRIQAPALAFDLDLPADLAWLRAHPPGGETGSWLAGWRQEGGGPLTARERRTN